MAEDQALVATEFEKLLEPVLQLAYGVAYRLTRSPADAEDLVQDSALQAFKFFGQFTPGTNFKAWLLRIMTRLYYADYRKRKRQPARIALEDAEPLFLNLHVHAAGLAELGADPARLVFERLGEAEIAEAMAALPDEFRLVCTLYFMQDASYQEIADILECPVGTVRSRLHRGRHMLQKAVWHLAEERGIIESLRERGGVA